MLNNLRFSAEKNTETVQIITRLCFYIFTLKLAPLRYPSNIRHCFCFKAKVQSVRLKLRGPQISRLRDRQT